MKQLSIGLHLFVVLGNMFQANNKADDDDTVVLYIGVPGSPGHQDCGVWGEQLARCCGS